MECKLCGHNSGDTRFGVCFDCASAQEIIGQQVLKEKKPIKTNEIIKTLAKSGYWIVDKKFVLEAEAKGIERDFVR